MADLSPKPSPVLRHGVFVTGTDTGVGKTLVTCALLHAYAARGKRVIGMKPVASGASWEADSLVSDDVRRILLASNVAAPHAFVNPYCFELATAPHIAARAGGVDIELRRIEVAFGELVKLADLVVVEGIGGWCVPLNEAEDTADLGRLLNLPVLLVVGLRLGCLNHALLSAGAIRRYGLPIAGWVANHIDPHMANVEDNISALTERLHAPLVARVGYLERPDPRLVAATIEVECLAGVC